MFAAWYGNKDISGVLLERGADSNIIPNDDEGMTALIAATQKGYKDIVILLLEHGANPLLKDKKGKTAIAYANVEIKQLLRQAGAQ
jgi:ankyrin repeat protein